MPGSAIRWLVVVFGAALLCADASLDFMHVRAVSAVSGWTSRLAAEAFASVLRNGILLVALVLVARGGPGGWKLLALAALLGIVRRGAFFANAAASFGSLGSPESQVALAAMDLVFRLFCMAAAVDVMRRLSQ
ncbi:MAG: hypothetical protein FJX76_09700 [Armatimonadetes bacterium]|nr:hypothetical protein [Armatimonadota bacterium]